MLSSHPNIAICRRTYFWTKFYKRYGDLSKSENFECCLTDIFAQRSMRFLNLDLEKIRIEYWRGPLTYGHLFAVIYRQYAEQLGRKRWGDQLAFVEHYSEDIFTAYPAAKIIQMVREPGQRYQESMDAYSKVKGRLGWDVARWQYSADLAMEYQDRYPHGYKVVRYELFMDDQENTLKEICAFVGEDYLPSMLEMQDAMRFNDGDDKISDVSKGDGKGNNRIFSNRDRAFVQSYARQSMLQLGYPIKTIYFSLGERLVYSVVDYPINYLSASAWRILESSNPT